MRVSEISLIGYHGEIRRLTLNSDGLNIITGESATGKSAIIHILDYCFGSKRCHVPLGTIREKVHWYCVNLVGNGSRVFVARRNPERGRHTSSDIYVESYGTDGAPSMQDIKPNTNIDGLKHILSQMIGLTENLHVPPEGATRKALEATISHAKIFCFQDQSIIDSKNQLFFSQQDGFVAQATKDTLPFFLGAVDQNQLAKQSELALLKKRLRQLERQQALATSWQSASIDRAQSFLSEARQVRLIRGDERPSDPEVVFDLLKSVPEKDLESSELINFDEELEDLEEIRDDIRKQYFAVSARIDDAWNLSSSRNDFGQELVEQKLRLSVLPPKSADGIVCPLCESIAPDAVHIVESLHEEINEVSDRITELKVHGPRLQKYIAELEERQENLRERIMQSQAQINTVIRQSDDLRSARDLRARQARVQGRISSFLDGVLDEDDLLVLEDRIAHVSQMVSRLGSDLSGDNFSARLRNAETNLENLITDYTKRLELEHSSGRTRLDIKNLTVVSETKDRTIKLEEMGSGDNWVGCHLAVHIALHRWFREKSRPVPSILVLDQPSKAHYPPELDTLSSAKDEDRRAVRRLFKFLYDEVDMPEPFQIIVLDHADEDEQWFQDCVVERWRDGLKLVPDSWPTQEE